MKKLETKFREECAEVQVNKNRVTIDNDQFVVIKDEDSLKVDYKGQIINVDAVIAIEENVYRVEIAGYTVDIRVTDPIHEALATSQVESGEVYSPMTGVISNILVEKGQAVEKGDVLCVISAMKMENKIVSTTTGKVSKILVEIDEQVSSGQMLVFIESTNDN